MRKECVEFVARLAQTCQVALLVDYPNHESTRWVVQKLLMAEMRLQFDAIYCYDRRQSPMKLDVSHILLDFCLFSDYITRHRQSLENPIMFVFIETFKDNSIICSRSNLFFGDGMVTDYTHILIGRGHSDQLCTEQVLSIINKPKDSQEISGPIQTQKICINTGLIDVLTTVEASKRRRIGNLMKSQNSFGMGSPEKHPDLLSDLRQRNTKV